MGYHRPEQQACGGSPTPRRERKGRLFEECMGEKLSDLRKHMIINIQGAQQTSWRMGSEIPVLRCNQMVERQRESLK